VIGWLLIFVSASQGLQRDGQDWLSVNLDSQIFADYSVQTTNVFTLTRLNPEIIEAVKRDTPIDENNLTPSPAVAVPEAGPTVIANSTPTPGFSALSLVPQPSPLLVSAGGPYFGDEGSPISLSVGDLASVVGETLGTITFHWDLDDDGLYDEAEGTSASVTFFDEGEYTIGIEATDLLGRVATDETTVSVRNVPPNVKLGADKHVDEGAKIDFSAIVNEPGNDLLFYEWNFGDGSQTVHDTLNPEHTFADNGDYAVRLRVKDNDGGVGEDYMVVYVGNLPPEVDAGPDQVVNEGDLVTLNGLATDPSASDTLTYAWDFNYDGTFTPDAGGPTASTIYPNGPANIVAALGVKDDDGGESIDVVNIAVNNVNPTIFSVSNNGPVGEGKPLTLKIGATDAGNDTLTYAFDWTNDGTFDAIGQPATLSHIWFDEGNYTVGIRADDGDGGHGFTTTVVSTFNLTPTAIAQGPGDAYLEGSKVPFDASESSDPGINDLLTYLWNFGDGSAASSGITATHAYADNGVYNAKLTVTDDSNAADSDTISVNILNANPVAEAGPDLVVDEDTNVLVSFNGSATDPGADSLTYDWDFSYEANNFVQEATGASVNRLYPALDGPTEYLVALRVRDDDYPYPTINGGQIGENIDTRKLIVKNVPPKNVEANGPYIQAPGQPVTLTASQAQDVPGDILTYAWDFDYDGSTFNADAFGQTVFHTWNAPGLYQVGLRVTDEDGGASFDTALVNINIAPTAEAGGPYSGLEGYPITFDGSGSSDPDSNTLTYIWDFGDGSPTANGMIAAHAYPDNSIYTATLIVIDTENFTGTDTVAVTILNADPLANVGPDLVANEGVPLNLIGSASTDPGSADVLTYAWDFDYDGINFNEDATGISVNVTYLDGPSVHTVAMRVRDDDYPFPTTGGGEIGEAMDILNVTVNNVPPLVNAGGPYLGLQGQPISLAGTATDVISDTLTYEWDLNYDGLVFNIDSVGQIVTNTWGVSGVYTTALRVTDKDGGVGLDTALVEVNTVPIANAGGPYSGNEGSPITLTGSGFDGDGDPLSYAWDLDNNGTFETPGQVVNNTWADNGVYTITLLVDDGRGGLATSNSTVTVSNVPPSIDAGVDQTVLEGDTVTLSGIATDPGSDLLTYEWDFDYDGVTFNVNDAGPTVSTIYPDGPAIHTVALRVNDGDGGISLDTLVITVSNVPPSADAGGPYTTTAGISITLAGNGSDVPADILTYSWDLNNDGIFETPGQTVTYTQTTPGTYPVILQVSDDDGGVTTDTTTVQVN